MLILYGEGNDLDLDSVLSRADFSTSGTSAILHIYITLIFTFKYYLRLQPPGAKNV